MTSTTSRLHYTAEFYRLPCPHREIERKNPNREIELTNPIRVEKVKATRTTWSRAALLLICK